jgi:cytochrome c-type biogenesis protein
VPEIGEFIGSGQLYFAVPIALLAGLLSFLSPCILPLVPGYLGYVGGVSGNGGKSDRGRLLLGVSLFILGFTLVFVAMNAAFGQLGQVLYVHGDLITRISGVVVIILGLVFIGQFTFLQRTVKPSWLPATGIAGAPLLGIVFGIGWTPCLGPTLITITSLSLDGGSPAVGVLLGAAYSLGLGIPFLLVAIGFGWVTTSVRWVKRHIRIVNIVGGALLILIGVLMVTGIWSLFMSWFGAVINGFVTAI